jgi:hypothetical protein
VGEEGNGVDYVDRNRNERDGEKRKWGGICRQKQGGKRWGEEGNGVEYVDRNREERDVEKRKWGGIRRQKQ